MVGLTRLELVAAMSAAQAVADLASPGLPGKPLLSAIQKLEEAFHESTDA
jgi:hypothetical protein